MTTTEPLATISVTPPQLTRRIVVSRPQGEAEDPVSRPQSPRPVDLQPSVFGVVSSRGNNAASSEIFSRTGAPLAQQAGVAAEVGAAIAATSPDQSSSAALIRSALAAATDGTQTGGRPGLGPDLTPEEEEQVRRLQERDREVRQHEQAHARAGGQFAGAPQYDFVTGPDGRQYAVSGSVSIDVSPVPNDPEATVEKAQVVRRAALAPSEPSAQDRAVAAEAAELLRDAQREVRSENQAEREARLDRAGPDTPGNEPADTQPAPFEPVAGGVGRQSDSGEGGIGVAGQDPVGPTVVPSPANGLAGRIGEGPASGESGSLTGASVINRRILSEVALFEGARRSDSAPEVGALFNLSA